LIGVLPADKLAVIVMSKVMELILPRKFDRSVPLIQVAIKVGEAIEQEVLVIFLTLHYISRSISGNILYLVVIVDIPNIVLYITSIDNGMTEKYILKEPYMSVL
jgi:DNA-directed RNA polymerase N-terminal